MTHHPSTFVSRYLTEHVASAAWVVERAFRVDWRTEMRSLRALCASVRGKSDVIKFHRLIAPLCRATYMR